MNRTRFGNIRAVSGDGVARNDIIYEIPLAETDDGDIGIIFHAARDGHWSFKCQYYGPDDGRLMDIFWRIAEQAEIQERVFEYVRELPKLPGGEERDVLFHGNRITGNGFRAKELLGLAVTVLMPCLGHVRETLAKYEDEPAWEGIMLRILQDSGGLQNLQKASLGDWLKP